MWCVQVLYQLLLVVVRVRKGVREDVVAVQEGSKCSPALFNFCSIEKKVRAQDSGDEGTVQETANPTGKESVTNETMEKQNQIAVTVITLYLS